MGIFDWFQSSKTETSVRIPKPREPELTPAQRFKKAQKDAPTIQRMREEKRRVEEEQRRIAEQERIEKDAKKAVEILTELFEARIRSGAPEPVEIIWQTRQRSDQSHDDTKHQEKILTRAGELFRDQGVEIAIIIEDYREGLAPAGWEYSSTVRLLSF